MKPTFEYGFAKVRDLRAETCPAGTKGLPVVTGIELNGQLHKPTSRFWSSFFRRFQVTENIFRYFSHAEVFERISQRARDEAFRYCVERNDRGDGRLLAATRPDRSVITYEEIHQLVVRYDAHDVEYEDGVVTSRHVPRSGDYPLQIGSDEFRQRFILDTPIDGYGVPRIHLSMLRTICTNGMVGYAAAFRSELSQGKDVTYGIMRALDSFDNFDGYAALRQRFDSAQRSWASIRETQELYRLLMKIELRRGLDREAVLGRFYRVSGRIQELYGLANLEALSVKRQRVLPAKCRVYDLMNFASEVGTHHAPPRGNRLLQSYLGTLVSDEYDLEGTGDKVPEFNDFFISQDRSPPAFGDLQPV